MKWRALKAAWTVVDLLRSPAYAVPLVVNLTGSVWFFLLIGKAGEFGEVFVRRISFLRGGGGSVEWAEGGGLVMRRID